MPRAWRLPLLENYEPGPPTNIVAMRTLSEPEASRLALRCKAPNARFANTKQLRGILKIFKDNELSIKALDVGHASCVAFLKAGKTFGYFDVGAPVHFNYKSYPKSLDHVTATSGFVILSHWDFDHFALAFKEPNLKRLTWFAPKQDVGANAARFQRSLGKRLFFLKSNLTAGPVRLIRCAGTPSSNKNLTGYVMHINLKDAGILLPGDADYQWIPLNVKSRTNRLLLPHHGASGSLPPSPDARPKPLAVISYGHPNIYRHPNEPQIRAHRIAGWKNIQRTARFAWVHRGNRNLYPL